MSKSEIFTVNYPLCITNITWVYNERAMYRLTLTLREYFDCATDVDHRR